MWRQEPERRWEHERSHGGAEIVLAADGAITVIHAFAQANVCITDYRLTTCGLSGYNGGIPQ